MLKTLRTLLGVCSLCLVLSLSPLAAETIDTEAILTAFCPQAEIGEDQCRRAPGYPNGDDCDVTLTGEIVKGRFLGSSAPELVLAVYQSQCEPHASNFGGSIVLESGRDRPDFKGYHPGLVVTGCVTVSDGSGGDRLVCNSAWMGQGYLIASISEVVFEQDASGAITPSLNDLVTAENSEGARGVNAVKCDQSGDDRALFSLDNLARGPATGTVSFEATYASAKVTASVCGKPNRNAPLGISPPLPNEAYVPGDQTERGQFVYDLEAQILRPEN